MVLISQPEFYKLVFQTQNLETWFCILPKCSPDVIADEIAKHIQIKIESDLNRNTLCCEKLMIMDKKT